MFPLAGTMYVPVCFPSFRPDQCIRKEEEEEEEEEEEGSPMSDKFKSLQNDASVETIEIPVH